MDLISIILFLITLNSLFYIIDIFFCCPFIKYFNNNLIKKDFNRTRWYLMHIIINICVALTSLNGVYNSYIHFTDSLTPIEMAKPFTKEWFYDSTSPLPTMLIASGHLYHILVFSVSKDDIYHHLLFALSMTSINMLYNYGYARNIISFVLSGLPGIFEYTLMVLFKFNYLSKKNMRYLVTFVHSILRFPLGFTIFLNFGYQILFNNFIESKIFVGIVAFLLLLNVTQYLTENIKASLKYKNSK